MIFQPAKDEEIMSLHIAKWTCYKLLACLVPRKVQGYIKRTAANKSYSPAKTSAHILAHSALS